MIDFLANSSNFFTLKFNRSKSWRYFRALSVKVQTNYSFLVAKSMKLFDSEHTGLLEKNKPTRRHKQQPDGHENKLLQMDVHHREV